MRLIPLFVIALFWSGPSRAEHINGLKTWMANDRETAGYLHYDAMNPGRFGWTTNGRTFDCAHVRTDAASFFAEVYCPTINYRFYLSRTQMQIQSSGGTTTYAGQWDDRRFWYYTSGATTGRFWLRDTWEWTEQQWVNDQIVNTFTFKEYGRDADFVYVYDASRNIEVAIGKTKVFVRTRGAAWTHFYNGSW